MVLAITIKLLLSNFYSILAAKF